MKSSRKARRVMARVVMPQRGCLIQSVLASTKITASTRSMDRAISDGHLRSPTTAHSLRELREKERERKREKKRDIPFD